MSCWFCIGSLVKGFHGDWHLSASERLSRQENWKWISPVKKCGPTEWPFLSSPRNRRSQGCITIAGVDLRDLQGGLQWNSSMFGLTPLAAAQEGNLCSMPFFIEIYLLYGEKKPALCWNHSSNDIQPFKYLVAFVPFSSHKMKKIEYHWVQQKLLRTIFGGQVGNQIRSDLSNVFEILIFDSIEQTLHLEGFPDIQPNG